MEMFVLSYVNELCMYPRPLSSGQTSMFWTSPDGQHQNQTDYILCSQRWGSPLQSAKTRPGADCGSYHELLIAKFIQKIGKTTRPPRYDLNQIPYDYTEKVINRFKRLDLIDRVPEELRTEIHDVVQEAVIKTIPKRKKCKKKKKNTLRKQLFNQ